jgi:hypothetical protein
VTRLRKIMLEELQRRNYSAITTRNYLRVVTGTRSQGKCWSTAASIATWIADSRFPLNPACQSRGSIGAGGVP